MAITTGCLPTLPPRWMRNKIVVGFHSNRRKPNPDQVGKVKTLYAALKAEETRHDNRKDGMLRGYEMSMGDLRAKCLSEEFLNHLNHL